jgi:large subunit ribosomal protein L9
MLKITEEDKMKVVLLEKIAKLGSLGNVVKVKDGFARNFLLPQKKALRATDANLAVFEKQRKDLEKLNEESKGKAEVIAKDLNGLELIIIRQASDTGVLYGSVSTKDIALELNNKKFSVLKNSVLLNHPIKDTGIYAMDVKIHPEVFATIKVNVARTLEEAQAIN